MISHWYNVLSNKRLSDADLVKLAKAPNVRWAKRQAALRMLRASGASLADFGPLVRAEKTLEELEDAGVNVRALKDIKPVLDANGVIRGNQVVLENDSLAESKEIQDRTEGRPLTAEAGDTANPFRIFFSLNIGSDAAKEQIIDVSKVDCGVGEGVALPPETQKFPESGENP